MLPNRKYNETQVNKCVGEFAGGTSTVILFSSHEQKITSKEANEEERRRGADRGACRTSHALRELHDLRIQGTRSAGRSGRAGSRQLESKNRSPGARPLAVPDGRRSRLASL